jgi:hypothetical protein
MDKISTVSDFNQEYAQNTSSADEVSFFFISESNESIGFVKGK